MRGVEYTLVRIKLALQHLKFLVALWFGLFFAGLFFNFYLFPYPMARVQAVVMPYILDWFGKHERAAMLRATVGPLMDQFRHEILIRGVIALTTSAALAVVGLMIFLWRTRRLEESLEREEVIRGARILDRPIKFRKKGEEVRLQVGDFEWPVQYENRGMMVLGTAGSGKSAFIKSLLEGIFDVAREEGHTVIVFDRKGEYLQYFYREKNGDIPGDLILNPADRRSVVWNIFEEISPQAPLRDIRSIAMSYIPQIEGSRDEFWRNLSRDMMASTLLATLAMYGRDGRPSNRELSELLMMPYEEFRKRIEQVPQAWEMVQSYFTQSRIRGDIEISFKQHMQPFMDPYVAERGYFSVRKFIREGGPNGERVMFISTAPHIQDAFRSFYALILDLMFKEILSLPDDLSRRVWMIIDEFPSLQKLESLERLLAEGRSKGSAVVIAAQDFTQIERIYQKGARSIFNNANTKVILRVTDPNSAEFISRAIGEQEVETTQESFVMGPVDMRDSMGLSRARKVQYAAMPAEIAELPDLTALVKVAHHPAFRFTFPYPEHITDTGIPALVPKEERAIEPPVREEKHGANTGGISDVQKNVPL